MIIMAAIKARITKKEAEKFDPTWIPYALEPMWSKGDHIAYNKGAYGWNWDLILYKGEYYVSGYRSFPKTKKKYLGGKAHA